MPFDASAEPSIPLGAQRLLALADVLDALPTNDYNQKEFGMKTDCGTVACAMGWGGLKIPEVLGYRTKFSPIDTFLISSTAGPARIDFARAEMLDLNGGSLNMFAAAEEI